MAIKFLACRMSKSIQNKILAEIVDVLKKNGVEVDSPYDVDNFFQDYGKHSDFFDCGKFQHLIDDGETVE